MPFLPIALKRPFASNRWFPIAVFGALFLFSSGLANAQPATDAPKADATPADAPPTAERKAFDEKFAVWKKSLSAINELQRKYIDANEAERKQLQAELKPVYEEANGMVPELLKLGMAAYAQNPKQNQDIEQFLISAGFQYVANCRYAEAIPILNAVLKGEPEKPQLFLAANAVSAFSTGDYEACKKNLLALHETEAGQELLKEDADKIPDLRISGLVSLAQKLPMLMQGHEELWKAEQKIREAEAKADDLPRVVLKTTKGDIVIELFENEAPNTVKSFISLVENKYYDGLTFHRVIPFFMAQGGCPDGTGSGGPDYHIPCECYEPNARKHFTGTLSMAHAGKDTGGSQFFLTMVPTRFLDGRHTAFGRVIEGMDVLGKLTIRIPEKGLPDPLPTPDQIIEAKVQRKRPGTDYSNFKKLDAKGGF